MTIRQLDSAAEQALRDAAPRVLGALVRRHHDFAAAEDAVQDAVLAAVVEWAERGAPANPGGWLYRVASRRLADRASGDEARRRRESIASDPADSPAGSAEATASSEHDDALDVLFACCHSALTPPSAIALTLRAVGGLTTAEIARAFLVPESTMAQRISRAKETLRSAGVAFEVPEGRERANRLADVLHVLYLTFNEGYAATFGDELVRVELATEAIRLTRMLDRSLPNQAEVEGLLALMLLTDARRRARTGPRGELIPLDEQDRTLWDRAAIAEGTALVTVAMGRGAVGPYQVQAAIAVLHDEAARAGDTDWPQILALYGLLARMSDNPVVALNRAIAAAMVHGPGVGLEMIKALDADERIASTHRLDAVRGHLYEFAGDRTAAVAHYRAAAQRTTSTPERDYLLQKAAKLANA